MKFLIYVYFDPRLVFPQAYQAAPPGNNYALNWWIDIDSLDDLLQMPRLVRFKLSRTSFVGSDEQFWCVSEVDTASEDRAGKG